MKIGSSRTILDNKAHIRDAEMLSLREIWTLHLVLVHSFLKNKNALQTCGFFSEVSLPHSQAIIHQPNH